MADMPPSYFISAHNFTRSSRRYRFQIPLSALTNCTASLESADGRDDVYREVIYRSRLPGDFAVYEERNEAREGIVHQLRLLNTSAHFARGDFFALI